MPGVYDEALKECERVKLGKLLDIEDEERRHALLELARMYIGFQLVDDEG